jgi:hypothetical protein
MARFLIVLGLAILVVGLLWPYLSKLGLGRLPGDIVIERENGTVYVPLATCLLLSLLLSLVLGSPTDEATARQPSTIAAGAGSLSLRAVTASDLDYVVGLLPVLLDARGAQAGEAMLVDRVLPGEEFLDRQRVAAAGLLERKEPAAHGGDDLGLAPDDPALGAWCRQIGDGQRAAVRPDDVFGPRSKGLCHQ